MNENSLTNFALRGLSNCWMPESKSWSHIYHLDGRSNPNESKPESDPFYSMNVILSISKLNKKLTSFYDVSIDEIFQINAKKIIDVNTPLYAKGMLLWAAAENGFIIDKDIERRVIGAIDNAIKAEFLSAQDAGLILTGCAAMRKAGRDGYDDLAHRIYGVIMGHLSCETDLYFDHSKKLRRVFSSFATNTYCNIGLFNYGEAYMEHNAIEKAILSSKKLIKFQGTNGEWPWFYHTRRGIVVDNYEVYSVHQDGMAPAFLHHAADHGVVEAREAIRKGFMWILGENQLGQSMLHPDIGMITRSIVRKGELNSTFPRVRRALINAVLGRADVISGRESIEARLECRSYHLGWVIWSFAGRDDYPEITENAAFCAAGA